MNGSAAVVQSLVNSQANVSAQNVHGTTPMHFAFARNERRCATVLLGESSADVNDPDNQGRTPLHVAFTARIAALERAGAMKANKSADIHVRGCGALDFPCLPASLSVCVCVGVCMVGRAFSPQSRRPVTAATQSMWGSHPAGSADDLARRHVNALTSERAIADYVEDLDEVCGRVPYRCASPLGSPRSVPCSVCSSLSLH